MYFSCLRSIACALMEVIHIEVKSSENLKAKSFRLFCEKYKPSKAIRTSLSEIRSQTGRAEIAAQTKRLYAQRHLFRPESTG